MMRRLGCIGGLGLVLLTSAIVSAAESTARLATFDKANGETYFALSLPPVAAGQVKPAEVVVLVDTSASQNGKFRDDSFTAVREMLGTLPAGTKVKLMAVDIKAVPMTEGFVDVKSEILSQGLANLNKRLPLGATDLPSGLRTAIESFDPASTMSKNVVYFGDGVSKANLVNSEKIQDLVRKAVGQQVSVSSYAIGAERNGVLLAAIANQTGGNLIVDSNDPQAPRQAGQFLAGTVMGQVIWPTSTSMPKAIAESFPTSVPPLRSDRDTVVVGRMTDKGEFKISVNGDANGKPVTMNWKATPEASHEDFAFLPQLVEVARPDGGSSLPTLGSAGLREAANVTQESADNLARLGEQALRAGNVEGAKQVATAILARDPKNPAGIALKKAANAPQAKTIAVSANADAGLRLVKTQQVNNLQQNVLEESTGLLGAEEELRLVMQGKIKAQVENGIADARSKMGSDAQGANQALKIILEMVERAPDLDSGLRQTLRGQVQAAIREAERRGDIQVVEDAANAERRAAAEEMKRINESLDRKTIKLKQIMDRFHSLMLEGKYQEATDNVAPEVTALAPDTPIEAVTKYSGRMQRAYHEMKDIWDRRERGFHEVMMLIEKAQIPFPDEPPVVYMDAEKWLDLTLRREKYKSVSLAKTGSAESRILDALKQTTQCDFLETPLKDVVAYFADLHQITIVLNQKELDEVGVTTDTPINKTLKGISLRSALRLILNDHGLTYMIRDEVLQITNPDAASKPENLIRKVYPVGDLVVPISLNTNLFGLGGSGLGGSGQGGLGGQVGGGFGGGQFGGQGGGAGGGPFGQGGGGAAFDVNDSLSLGTKKPAGQPAEAKPADVKAEAKPATITGAVAPKKVASVNVKVAEGSTLAEAWDRYFAEQKQLLAGQANTDVAAGKFAAVRQTVRELVENKKFAEVVAVLQGAVRHGQVESWMYEALTLSLDATNAPADEIERTMMSAVDYASDEEQLMMIAAYMVRLGHDARGLAIYQQAAQANPARPEAFIRGLEIAQRLNNFEGVKWSSLGLISQAWPREQRHLGEQAFRAAKATYAELLRQGKEKEAREFEMAAAKAAARDVVVEVKWTGDADIDVQVNEPAGTFCSYRQQRSTSGGVFGGDSYAAGNRPMGGSYSELYICSQGFAGEYQVQLKNVWGKVAGGKVTVDIYTNYLTDKGQKIHHQIPIGDKDALVVFELKEGRRQEALPEAQVANVAKAQNAVDRGVLAQQLAALNQSSTAQQMAMERARLQQMGIDPNFFRRTGAVGYRPIITTLPEGANFSTNAVISADRRYVRVSPAPTFSQVTDVVTYNTSSGATNNTTNQFGGGGNGFFGGQGGGGAGGGNGGGGGGGFGGVR